MTGIVFIELVSNAIIFTFIFWILTFVAKYTYSNKFYNFKLNFYECGFKNFSKKNVTFELNFILLILFLLIYDGEFFILIPFALNSFFMSYEILTITLFFFIWFVVIILLDYVYYGLEWQITDLFHNFFTKIK